MTVFTSFSLQSAITFGYLIGSIPFGLIFTWYSGYGDIRKIGSTNIGATNVLRTGRIHLALFTLTFDISKGVVSTFIFMHISGSLQGILTGYAAIIGHIFPIWLGFQGGKGIATTFGILILGNWIVGIIAIIIWLFMTIIFRISSLSAIISIMSTPCIAFFIAHDSTLALLLIFLFIIILITHHGNIYRLIQRKEPQIKYSNKKNQ